MKTIDSGDQGKPETMVASAFSLTQGYPQKALELAPPEEETSSAQATADLSELGDNEKCPKDLNGVRENLSRRVGDQLPTEKRVLLP